MLRRLRDIVMQEFRRNPYLIGFVAVLAGLLLWALLAPLPKRSIKRVIREGRRAVEARDVDALRLLLAEEFDSSLTGDRDETIEHLREAFRHVLSLQIKIKRTRINVEGERATALVEFYVSGAVAGGDVYPKIPFRGLGTQESDNPLERARLAFVKETDGDWRIAGVELIGPSAAGKVGDFF